MSLRDEIAAGRHRPLITYFLFFLGSVLVINVCLAAQWSGVLLRRQVIVGCIGFALMLISYALLPTPRTPIRVLASQFLALAGLFAVLIPAAGALLEWRVPAPRFLLPAIILGPAGLIAWHMFLKKPMVKPDDGAA